MLQRVMIAMALLLKPQLLVADEPTTALDVTVQAQVMELLLEMVHQEGASLLLITHNLGLVAQYADHLSVMYAGRMVERAPVRVFFESPRHPYSSGLLGALPDLQASHIRPIEGMVPPPQEFSSGCRFAPRCPKADELCEQRPPWQGEDHCYCCFHPQ